MKDFFIGLSLLMGIFVLISFICTLAICWAHYPGYAKKGGKKFETTD